MEARGLLDSLQGRGFVLSAAQGGLFVTPRAALTTADTDAIRANKPELLELLGVVFAKPYLDESGDLRIPFDSHPRYHYWAGGQSLLKTLVELNAPVDIWRRYVAYGFHLSTPKHADICKGQVERLSDLAYCADCGYFTEAM
jgi:hypothetical protein